MGLFFSSSQPVLPAIRKEFESALLVDPKGINASQEAAKRALDLTSQVAPKFSPWRFGAAVAISVGLLCVAIWTAKNNLPDISKALMNSFVGFSGIVMGLLGGEAQKSV